jgi:hypothetical protein
VSSLLSIGLEVPILGNAWRYQPNQEVSSLLSIGPRGAYFWKLLEISCKQAKVDGCKPSFQAKACRCGELNNIAEWLSMSIK